MKHGIVNIAAASPEVFVASPRKNADKMISLVREAAEKQVKVLVFPELSISAYSCSDLFLSDKLLDDSISELARIASETSDCDVLFFAGFPLSYRGALYNCAAAVLHGEILGIIPKSNIPNYGEFYEKRHFAAAPAKNSFVNLFGKSVPFGAKLIFDCENMPSLSVGCEICEDMWVAAPPSAELASAGATVIVNPSASDELIGKDEYRRTLVSAASGRYICAYAFAGASCEESTTDLVFSGHCIIAENGVIKAENPPFGECRLTIVSADTAHLMHDRIKTQQSSEKNSDAFLRIPFTLEITETDITGKIDPEPFIPGDITRRREVCSRILDIQARGLAKRLTAAHAKCAVIGISGGLDSCLALLVSIRAMEYLSRPANDIIAVTMPCYGTTGRTRTNAETLCSELGCSFRCIDIADAVAVHFKDIGHDPHDHSVVYENSQARERTQIIMDIANGEGGIVVGTGDLSELALGWATYNGDHMSNYGVNAGVPKTLVRHIVSYYADEAESKGRIALSKVLKDILATPVSPELLPPKEGEIAQRTEDIVGPYELHDFFLYHFVRWGETPDKIFRLAKAAFGDEYSDNIIKGWLKVFMRRFFTQQFKRSALPDGPKVGSVALSPRGDWKMPSDAEIWDIEL